MIRANRRLTRQQLFDLVWQRPIRALATEFGISDVGLRNLCRRVGVPVPERGYWARLRFGESSKRPHLPPTPAGQSDQVIIEPSRPGRRELEENLPPDIAAQVEAERNAKEPITVPKSPSPHAIVAGWKVPLRSGANSAKQTPAESRRQHIATVLFREVEKRGGKVSAKDPYHFEFTLLGEKLDVLFEERTKMHTIPPDPRSSWSYERREWVPTGFLRFRIENYLDVPVRREWNETEGKPLEVRLREVIVALSIAAAAERQRRLRFEEENRRRHLAEIQRWEFEEQRRKEESRIKELIKGADSWAQANRIREYVTAAENAGVGAGADSAELQEWVTWARAVAQRLDPLESVGDREKE